MNPFKTLRGRRILIEVPVKKESVITLYAIGDKVEEIAVGDSVYIPTGQLEHAEKVDIDGSVKLMFNEMDIAIIW